MLSMHKMLSHFIIGYSVQATNRASSLVDIYPTTFNCDGTESTLIDCTTGTDTSSFDHQYDAYVNCQTSKKVYNLI